MQRYFRTAKSITQLNTILLQNLGAAIFPEKNKAPIVINERFQNRFSFLWDQVKAGASLYTLSLRQRSQMTSESTFLEIARFLHFLVDRELVDDLRLVHLSDAIRGEYSWPSSFATLYESEHAVSSWGSSPGRQKGASKKWGSFMDLGVAFLSMLGVVVSVVGYPATWRQEAPLPAVSFFVAWFSAGVLGRTLTAVLRGLLAKSGGDAGEFNFSFDILGPSLSFQPLVLSRPYRGAPDFIPSQQEAPP